MKGRSSAILAEIKRPKKDGKLFCKKFVDSKRIIIFVANYFLFINLTTN